MKAVCEKRFVRVHFETKENEGTCKTLNKLKWISYKSRRLTKNWKFYTGGSIRRLVDAFTIIKNRKI